MKEVKCHWSHGTVLVCANERDPASGKAFCGHESGVSLRNWMKERRNKDGLKGKVLVSVASCLGVCPNKGTVVAITANGSSAEPEVLLVDPENEREELWQEVTERLNLAECIIIEDVADP